MKRFATSTESSSQCICPTTARPLVACNSKNPPHFHVRYNEFRATSDSRHLYALRLGKFRSARRDAFQRKNAPDIIFQRDWRNNNSKDK